MVAGKKISSDKTKVLGGPGSLLLDTLRIVAALTVLVCHGFDQWYPSDNHEDGLSGKLAHTAVVVFFVLSGFVIAYTTSSRNRGPLQYAVARLSRLCSVVLPALVITAIIQIIIFKSNPIIYEQYTRKPDLVRYFLSATFLNESWFLSAAPPLNRPLWSLSFEFWYYAIFGAWIFKGASKMGLIIFLLVSLLAGPKILLMMPIWLMGCISFWRPSPKLPKQVSWVLIFSLLIIAVFLMLYLPAYPNKIGAAPFYFASQFVTDWIVGVLIAVALWVLPLESEVRISSKWIVWFRKFADLTFPIYVLHHPFLVLYRAVIGFEINNTGQMWMAIISAFLISSLIGLVLETQRMKWMIFFTKLLGTGRSVLVKFIPSTQNTSNRS
jgi:peptidoglycan/LPS O-acetylase OafA/YrhL